MNSFYKNIISMQLTLAILILHSSLKGQIESNKVKFVRFVGLKFYSTYLWW
jgi:hypothetical protein